MAELVQDEKENSDSFSKWSEFCYPQASDSKITFIEK